MLHVLLRFPTAERGTGALYASHLLHQTAYPRGSVMEMFDSLPVSSCLRVAEAFCTKGSQEFHVPLSLLYDAFSIPT